MSCWFARPRWSTHILWREYGEGCLSLFRMLSVEDEITRKDAFIFSHSNDVNKTHRSLPFSGFPVANQGRAQRNTTRSFMSP